MKEEIKRGYKKVYDDNGNLISKTPVGVTTETKFLWKEEELPLEDPE